MATGKGVRDKGHAGERQFGKDLAEMMGLKIPIERNVDQVRYGGADIISLAPFAIEVKRQEQLHINAWRKQALEQVSPRNPYPVLAYRQNRRPWVVQIPLMVLVKKKFRSKQCRWVSMALEDFAFIALRIINS